MLPDDGGLALTPHGQTVLAVVLVFLGVVVWTVLMISGAVIRSASDFVLAAAVTRSSSPFALLTFQTVVKRWTIRKRALVFASFTVAPPLLFLIGRFLLSIGDGVWNGLAGWWPIIGIASLVTAAGVGVFLIVRRQARTYPTVNWAQLEPEAGPVRPVQPAPQMWSAPTLNGRHWSDPDV